MKFLLAPLADFTDAPFRLMCELGGADGTYTEMVSAAALYHGHAKTDILLETLPQEKSVACQIFGAKEEEVALAVAKIDALGRFAEINLNAGCPMNKVTRSGSGAKLVEDPAKIYSLLRAMKENTSAKITLKTRLGPNPDRINAFEIISAAESAGASEVAFHARFTSQMHGGPLHLDILAEAVERSKLPIIGNGSISDLKTLRAFEKTGVKGVMIGRAAMSKPWIFSELKKTPSLLPADGAECCRLHLEKIAEHQRNLAAKYRFALSLDAYSSVKMHTHLFRYFNGRPGSASLRARLNKVRTLTDIDREISMFETQFCEGPVG